MPLQCFLGRHQALGDHRLAILESLARHWYRYGDRIAEWIVQCNSNRANSERVFFAVIGDAAATSSSEIAEQCVKPRQCFRRAGFVNTPDERFDSIVGELRQISLPIGGAVERKGVPYRGDGAQALRADYLIDEHEL